MFDAQHDMLLPLMTLTMTLYMILSMTLNIENDLDLYDLALLFIDGIITCSSLNN